MKVILLENVKRIGSIGEVIDVKRGFARNFLIANKKALYASVENIKEVEKIKSNLGKKDLEKNQDAKKIMQKINEKIYLIKKLSTENKELYGSVKPTEISKFDPILTTSPIASLELASSKNPLHVSKTKFRSLVGEVSPRLSFSSLFAI